MTNTFSPEVRERAVRMLDHERDRGGVATERGNREVRQAIEILRTASAYFAQAPFGARRRSPAGQGELDLRFKPIGNIPPVQAEDRCHAMLREQKLAV